MENHDARSNLLNELFISFAGDRAAVNSAIGLCIFNECIWAHLFQCGLETCGQLATAKQLADIGTRNFVVNLDGSASGLVRRDRCSGLASFDIGFCFESGSGLRVLFLPRPDV